MKIVRIIARLNVGGPARHTVWLTQALNDDGFQSTLITGTVPEGEEDMNYFAAQNAVAPLYIPEMSRELSPNDAVSLWKIFRALLREKPDIIHTHTAKAGTTGRAAGFLYRWLTPKTLIGRPRKVRLIHTFHGHVFHSYYAKNKTRVFLFIERLLARFATDKIIVISRQQFEEIHSHFHIGRTSQFEIIPLGIDLEPYAMSDSRRDIYRKEIGASSDEILVGIVGRLTEVKNHSMFLRVAAAFKSSRNENSPKLKFVIVGDGHLRPQLEMEVKQLGIDDLVIFAGNRDDAENFYAAMDIVALTSLNEGTPLSLIEAMASGRAFVATKVGGVVDLLGEKTNERDETEIYEHGIGVESNDVSSFLKGLILLAEDGALRADLARSGKQFAFANYSKERLISDIRKLYLQLFDE